uniref:Uncharacterized protein n=1 Tax=Oryza glumipatula TaxID=40148 RepID=A0A0E0BR08_9ORYZ
MPKAKPAASTGLWDVLVCNGLALERMNGRLAMVGFVLELAMEAPRGGGLLDQAGSGGVLAWFATTAAVRPSRPRRRRCLCPSPCQGGGCSSWPPSPLLPSPRPTPPPAPASIRHRAEGRLLVVAAAVAASSSPAAAAPHPLPAANQREREKE